MSEQDVVVGSGGVVLVAAFLADGWQEACVQQNQVETAQPASVAAPSLLPPTPLSTAPLSSVERPATSNGAGRRKPPQARKPPLKTRKAKKQAARSVYQAGRQLNLFPTTAQQVIFELDRRGVRQTVAVGAALKLMLRYELGDGDPFRADVRAIRLSAEEILSVLARHTGIQNSAKISAKLQYVLRPSQSIVLHYLFAMKNPTLADVWADILRHKTSPPRKLRNPAWALGEMLYTQRKRFDGAGPMREEMAAAIVSWNMLRNGERGVPTFNSADPFPQIL